MDTNILMGILNNAILLLGLGVIYSVMPVKKTKSMIIQSFVIGLLISMIVVFVMLNPFPISEGVVLDTRSILISVSAFFFGLIPTLMTVITASIVRIDAGGSGTTTGLLVIFSSGLIGLLFRKFRYNIIMSQKIRRLIEFFIFAIVVHVVMLIMFLALPEDSRFEVIKSISSSVLLLYPIVTVFYAVLIFLRYDNVTERDKLISDLIKEKQLSRITLLSVGDGVISTDNNGTITLINTVAEDLTGWKREEAIGKNIEEVFCIFEENTNIRSNNIVQEVIESGVVHELDNHTVLVSKTEEERPIEDSAAPIISSNGEVVGVVLVFKDVTEKKQVMKALLASERNLKQAQEIGKIGSWELVLTENRIWASDESFNIYGLKRETNYIDLNVIQAMVHDEDKNRLTKELEDLIKSDKIYDITYKLRLENDTIKYINSKASLIKDIDGKPSKVIGVIHDVTDFKIQELELEYAANNDYLTGIFNRRYYEENLMKLDSEENYPLTIIMADINGLKLINDAFGHLSGDKVLISASKIISDSCRKTDLLARIGGDEFVIAMPKTNESEAEEIIKNISVKAEEVKIESIPLSISFGYKTKYDKEEDIQDIYRSAEDSMYRQKLIEIPSMRSSAIETILTTLYEKDINSENHSRRVSNISERLAKAYGLERQEVSEVKTAGLLHDIGKIIIPINIINKVGKLTKEEYDSIKTHPEIGFRILNSTSDMRSISNIILNHHERWDGKGYPRGIKADEIPLQARIISIADAFDAMTTERTYRQKISKEDALLEIVNNSSTQFDPDLVKIFKSHFDTITSD